MKVLILSLKAMICFLLITWIAIGILYLRAYFILGHVPQIENEEARSLGFEKVINILTYFWGISFLVAPTSIIVLVVLLYKYHFRPQMPLILSMALAYFLTGSVFLFNPNNIFGWLFG